MKLRTTKPAQPYRRTAYRQAAAILVVAALAAGCEAFLTTTPYLATELPDDVTELFETAGDSMSRTVWIYEQGGPVHELDPADAVYDELGIYRGEEDVQLVMAHQTLTLNHDLAARYRDLSLADLQAEVDVGVEILRRTIEHFRAQGKRVVVIGHSYGAFLIPRYLWRHGPDAADRYLIMAGRLDMPMEVVNAFLQGTPWYFPDAVTPTPPPAALPREFTDREHIETRIAAATGHDRYTERLAETDLRRVVYVYGTEDKQVGRLTAKEVAFLDSRGAQVIPVEGGDHGSMFENSAVIQKISDALQE